MQKKTYRQKVLNNTNIGVFLVVVHLLFIFFIYQFCIKEERTIVLRSIQEHANQLYKISYNKLKIAAAHKFINLDNANLTILEHGRYLKICNKNLCTQYHLLKLQEALSTIIPSYLYYQIELDNSVLLNNMYLNKYETNKVFQVNKAHTFNIKLSYNHLYDNKVNIRKFFWYGVILFIFDLSFLIFLYQRLVIKNYTLHIRNKLLKKYDDTDTALKREIWNNEAKKLKDVEINYLFSQKANQIILIKNMCEEDNSFFHNITLLENKDKLPCSIILYQFDKPNEPVSIRDIVKLIKIRFRYEKSNIQFSIVHSVEIIEFVSKEALCQLIYSFLHYIYYKFENQSLVPEKHAIAVSINEIDGKAVLYFEYDGMPIATEQEFLNGSIRFYRTHANPFIIGPIELLNLLKSEGCDYNIGHHGTNFLELGLTKGVLHNTNESNHRDNLISLDLFRNKDHPK